MGSSKKGAWWGYTLVSIVCAVVFFYQPMSLRKQIWSTVLSIHPNPLYLAVICTMLFHCGSFLLLNAIMYVIYSLNHPFFEQFKVQKKVWPWLDENKETREQWRSLVNRALLVVTFNEFIIVPVMIYLNFPITSLRNSYDIQQLPEWYTSVWQICVCMMCEDTLFHFSHRLLHHRSVYGYFHKLHHEYKTTIGLASEYTHPVEFVISSVIPFSSGPLLLGVHGYTLFMWTLLRTGETIDGHSGYEFPWSPYRLLPFSGSSSYHDYHHSHNVGNYSSFFTWWDTLFGTNVDYYKFAAKQEQHQKSVKGQ